MHLVYWVFKGWHTVAYTEVLAIIWFSKATDSLYSRWQHRREVSKAPMFATLGDAITWAAEHPDELALFPGGSTRLVRIR